MRSGFIALIFSCLFVNIHCDKNYLYTPDSERLSTALLNGNPWNAESFLYFREGQMDTVDILMVVYNKDGFLREKLSFYNIPLILGTHLLSPTSIFNADAVTGARYGTYLGDGDVSGERYFVTQNNEQNWIELTEVNHSKGVIAGSYEVVMPIDSLRGKVFETSPDTVKFTQGRFKTKEE